MILLIMEINLLLSVLNFMLNKFKQHVINNERMWLSLLDHELWLFPSTNLKKGLTMYAVFELENAHSFWSTRALG